MEVYRGEGRGIVHCTGEKDGRHCLQAPVVSEYSLCNVYDVS